MTIGRPTKYDESYCQVAIDFMGQGYSLTALAGHLGVAKSSIYEWMSANPEFSSAISMARTGRVLALERDMLTSDNNAVINARKFALINADKDEWQLTPNYGAAVPGGENHKVTITVVSPEK